MMQSVKIANTPDEALYELREINGIVRYPTGTLVIANRDELNGIRNNNG